MKIFLLWGKVMRNSGGAISLGFVSLDSLWQFFSYTVIVVALILVLGAVAWQKKERKEKFTTDLLSSAFLSNCKYKIALGLINCGVFDFDPKTGKITRLTSHIDKEVACLIDGTPKKVVEENMIDKEYIDIFLKMFNDFVFGASTTEIVVKTCSQKVRWVRFTLTSYRDLEETTIGAIGTIEDITEEKENQIKLAQEHKNHLEMKQAAENDSLTGLLNRRSSEIMISCAVEKTLQNGNLGVFFMIDLDYFKSVNDNLGHVKGDLLLQETANELKNIFPDDAIVGRMGGDEFCVYMGDVGGRSEVAEQAHETCKTMQGFFRENKECGQVSASVGLAFCPFDGSSFSELYKNADIALYDAKSRGKNTFCVFGCTV